MVDDQLGVFTDCVCTQIVPLEKKTLEEILGHIKRLE